MGMNPIGDDGVKAILKGVAANPRLRLVGLEVCMNIHEFMLKVKFYMMTFIAKHA